jgi:hypothetical protein
MELALLADPVLFSDTRPPSAIVETFVSALQAESCNESLPRSTRDALVALSRPLDAFIARLDEARQMQAYPVYEAAESVDAIKSVIADWATDVDPTVVKKLVDALEPHLDTLSCELGNISDAYETALSSL